MEIMIYHGSESVIRQPEYGFGKRYNDYGLGFYCTKSVELAKEWGVDDTHDGYANAYRFSLNGMKILNLNSRKYSILNWLSVLIENREFDAPSVLAKEAKRYLKDQFSVEYENMDVIVGYRADDSYFSFAQDFLNGTISYRQLSNAMQPGELGEQIVLKSRRAFDSIQFEKAEPALREEWLARKKNRDTLARHAYFEEERNRRQKGDIYITQILDEEMTNDDPRLR